MHHGDSAYAHGEPRNSANQVGQITRSPLSRETPDVFDLASVLDAFARLVTDWHLAPLIAHRQRFKRCGGRSAPSLSAQPPASSRALMGHSRG